MSTITQRYWMLNSLLRAPSLPPDLPYFSHNSGVTKCFCDAAHPQGCFTAERAHTRTHTQTYRHTASHTHTHTPTVTLPHAHTHTLTHTHAHTHTHTITHTRT